MKRTLILLLMFFGAMAIITSAYAADIVEEDVEFLQTDPGDLDTYQHFENVRSCRDALQTEIGLSAELDLLNLELGAEFEGDRIQVENAPVGTDDQVPNPDEPIKVNISIDQKVLDIVSKKMEVQKRLSEISKIVEDICAG
jgi:hypothetical protein